MINLDFIQDFIDQQLVSAVNRGNAPYADVLLYAGANPNQPGPKISYHKSPRLIICDKEAYNYARNFDLGRLLSEIFSDNNILAMHCSPTNLARGKWCETGKSTGSICSKIELVMIENIITGEQAKSLIDYALSAFTYWTGKPHGLKVDVFNEGYSGDWNHINLMVHAINQQDASMVRSLHAYGADIYFDQRHDNKRTPYIVEFVNSTSRVWLCENELPVVKPCVDGIEDPLCCAPGMQVEKTIFESLRDLTPQENEL